MMFDTRNFLIMGVQGSGKGTHGKNISDIYGIPHIATGDLLRSHIVRKTKIGMEYQEEYDKGNFAPDTVLFKMITDELDKDIYRERGYVLDGFPRNIAQLQWFIEQGYDFHIDKCIHLKIPKSEAIKRMKERNRTDDNDEAIQKRLNIYFEVTNPLLSYYETQGKLITINSDQEIDNTFSDIQRALIQIISTEKIHQ